MRVRPLSKLQSKQGWTLNPEDGAEHARADQTSAPGKIWISNAMKKYLFIFIFACLFLSIVGHWIFALVVT